VLYVYLYFELAFIAYFNLNFNLFYIFLCAYVIFVRTLFEYFFLAVIIILFQFYFYTFLVL